MPGGVAPGGVVPGGVVTGELVPGGVVPGGVVPGGVVAADDVGGAVAACGGADGLVGPSARTPGVWPGLDPAGTGASPEARCRAASSVPA